MTPEFMAMMTARLGALTAELEFTNTTAGLISPRIIETMLPPKDKDYVEFDEFPLVCWAVHEGEVYPRKPSPFVVVLTGGIYTAGSIADGSRDIMRLAMALCRIVDDRAFPPYRLDVPVKFSIGDPREGYQGLQPHPVYWLTMNLNFLVP